MRLTTQNPFPRPFQHYRPRSQKVYGVVCVSTQGTVLLVRGRRLGIWSFPKGHLIGNELGHECALRELKEETGIELSKIDYTGSRKLYAGEYFFYTVEDEIPIKVHDTNEIDAAGWFTLDTMREMRGNIDVVSFLKRI
jgi:8-oxo-dGTP pyrophosphatase MutT (NUDIX family)